MVLATLVATAGSTYRRPGALALCLPDGEVNGLLSGGCVEADLALRALRVQPAQPALVHYDLRGEDPMGLGGGCEGELTVLLERIDEAHDPLLVLAAALDARAAGVQALVFDGPRVGSRFYALDAPLPGARGLAHDDGLAPVAHAMAEVARVGRPRVLAEPRALVAPVPRVTHLLVVGAGPDAGPLVAAAQALGHHVTVWDHRPAALLRPCLASADERRHVPVSALEDAAARSSFDAVVVMTHALASDAAAVRGILRTRSSYVGLLGPRHRADKIREAVGDTAATRALRAPIGLDLGAETPEAIALSIVAEIQAVLAGRAGGALSERRGAIHERAA